MAFNTVLAEIFDTNTVISTHLKISSIFYFSSILYIYRSALTKIENRTKQNLFLFNDALI